VTDRIDLIGISARARHGALPIEQEREQLFVVDVSVFADLSEVASSDSLEDTLDYGSLAQRIHDLVTGESHALLETLAARVSSMVLSDPRVEKVRVTVHKPEAPIEVPFQDVSVTFERAR